MSKQQRKLETDRARLYVKTFGMVDLMYEGRSIFKERQRTNRINSLLEYFIVKHNRPCAPEDIALDLWPDVEFIDEKKVLQTYIHRLKNIISGDNACEIDFSADLSISSVKGMYQMKFAEGVGFDADVFMELVKRSSEPLTAEDASAAADTLLAVYRDHYLAGSSHDQLVMRTRNNYRHLCVRAVANLISKVFDNGDFGEVIRIAEAFFTHDDLDEKINLIYLQSLINANQRAGAARHYNYICQKTQDTLAICVSPEISALFSAEGGGMSAESPAVKGSESPIDEGHILKLVEAQTRKMVEDIVNEKIAKVTTNFTCVHIKLKVTAESALLADMKRAVRDALRKNDVYAMTGPNTAVAMMCNMEPRNADLIRKRFELNLRELCHAEDDDIEIEFLETITL